MRVIVTGASGFIGRNLLLSTPKNWDVVAIYNKNESFLSFLKQFNLTNIIPIKCDLTDAKLVQTSLKADNVFDLCIYLSSNSDPTLSVKEPFQDLTSNVIALINFLTNTRIERMIYFSSGAVYDGLKGKVSPLSVINPRLPYAISKMTAEHYVRSFSYYSKSPANYLIIRFFGAYGPFEPPRKIYTKLIQAFHFVKQHFFKIRGDGQNLIDAMYIDDTIKAILALAERKDLLNLTLDLCTGNPMSLIELVNHAARIFKIEDLKIENEGETAEYAEFYGDPIPFQKLTGFKPTVTLVKGLEKFTQFLESGQFS